MNTSSTAPHNERWLIFIIGLIQFVNILDFMMVMPLGPDFAEALGIPASHIGYVGGAYTLAAAVTGFVGAFFLDRYRRKPVLLWSLLGLIAATGAAALAWNMPSLIAARLLAGMFGGTLSAVSLALIADCIPPERRGNAMGKVMGAFAAASVLGVPFGLELARMFNWQTPFLVLSAGGVAVWFAARRILPELPVVTTVHSTGEQWQKIKSLFGDKIVLAAFGFMALGMGTGFMIIPNISAHVQLNLHYPREKIGLLYLFGGLVSFFGMRLVGKLADKMSAVTLSSFFGVSLSIALVLGFIWYPNPLPIVPIFMLFMLSMTGRNIVGQTLSSKVPPPALRATFMSLQSSLTHLASSLGAFVASLMLSQQDGRLVGIENVAYVAIGGCVVIPLLYRVAERGLGKRG
jgi:predicted MFS family arabinose efflux permease